jgi:hypothetical protein
MTGVIILFVGMIVSKLTEDGLKSKTVEFLLYAACFGGLGMLGVAAIGMLVNVWARVL